MIQFSKAALHLRFIFGNVSLIHATFIVIFMLGNLTLAVFIVDVRGVTMEVND